MSEENVEAVRQSFAAFNRGDDDQAVSIFHPDAVWIPYLGVLDAEIYRGREAIRKMWLDIRRHLRGFRVEPKEFIDCDEQVVVAVEAAGAGSGSGAEVTQRWAQVWSIKDGLAVRVEAFPSREAALEAAGLSEEDAQ